MNTTQKNEDLLENKKVIGLIICLVCVLLFIAIAAFTAWAVWFIVGANYEHVSENNEMDNNIKKEREKLKEKCDIIKNRYDKIFMNTILDKYDDETEDCPKNPYCKRKSRLSIKKEEKNYKEVDLDTINLDVKSLGIGGLAKQMEILIYDVLLSRLLPDDVKARYKIKDEKGVILYGPPGTGKTLIARNVAKIIPGSIVTYINGPELKNPFYGVTSNKIRKLFDDPKANPDETYILIFDEIDAIGMKRTGDNKDLTGNDLTQLLTMIDGVESIPNVLIVGITNRLDTLDPALIRNGRLGKHIEIPLPDTDGRKEILNIYLGDLVSENIVQDVNVDYWAEKLSGYSGADIESFVQQIKQLALKRSYEIVDGKININSNHNILITNDDFENIFNAR